MTIPLQSSVVYGPVKSRRLGFSLGINLLPTDVKFCLSNCVYCQYGDTIPGQMKGVKLPSAQSLLEQIEKDFSRIAAQGVMIDAVTFSGNGEPTLHPELELIVSQVKALRDRFFPKARLGILSDSTRVHMPHVRKVLEQLDDRFMKLDVGDPETYALIDRPINRSDWNAMIDGLKKLSDMTIQSLFMSAPVDNASGTIFDHWLKQLTELRPKGVHVYTLDRTTQDPGVKPVTLQKLQEIAALVQEKLPDAQVEYFGKSESVTLN